MAGMVTRLRERSSVSGDGERGGPRFDLAPTKAGRGPKANPGNRRRGAGRGGLRAGGPVVAGGIDRTGGRFSRCVNAVERGQVITVDDLQVVGIGSDDQLALLADSQADLVVGRVARTDLPAGALITAEQFSDGSLITAGEGVVGLSLEPGQFPSLALSAGDVVAVVLTPASGDPRAFADDTVEASVLVERATVAEVSAIGVQGHLFVAIPGWRESDAARVGVGGLGQPCPAHPGRRGGLR